MRSSRYRSRRHGLSVAATRRQAAPEDERAAAYKTCIAYSGPFAIEGDWILHNIDVSTYPNWVGGTLRRRVQIENGDVVLLTAPQPQDGVETVIKLVWQRPQPWLG